MKSRKGMCCEFYKMLVEEGCVYIFQTEEEYVNYIKNQLIK